MESTTPKFPDKRYAVVVADPPWNTGGYTTGVDGRVQETPLAFGIMPLRDIKAMPVQDIMLPDCWVFIWTI